MKFLLIILVFSNGPAVTTHEFESAERCEFVGKLVVQHLDKFGGYALAHHFCIPTEPA